MRTQQDNFDFGDPNQFIENPEQRAPCVLLLDTSSSMAGHSISQLNAGLHALVKGVSADSLALSRVEIAIVVFGSEVEVVHPFATADHIVVPHLTASGSTPMGPAMDLGAATISARMKEYRKSGVPCLTPHMFLISDGAPDRGWEAAARRIGELDRKGKLHFFPVGVDGADLRMMSSIGTRPAMLLRDADFPKLFEWVSYVMSSYSASRPGGAVQLPPVTWGEVRA